MTTDVGINHYRLGDHGKPPVDAIACYKCGAWSGDDWSQCEGSCPMPGSPHYTSTKDALGDRMKFYEGIETQERFEGTDPIYVRIDGRGFSKFTRGMDKPYDHMLAEVMEETTRRLVEHTHALIGYTQSDEITLVFLPPEEGDVFFGGKIQKMVSVLAAYATTAFCHALAQTSWGLGHLYKLPHFDARAFQVPNQNEAVNAVLWRIKDAERNSVQMLAQALYSHHQLQKKSTRVLRGMIDDAGVDYDQEPDRFRRGAMFRRVVEARALTDEEWMAIDQRHRPLREATFPRSRVSPVAFPEKVDWAWLNDTIFGTAE